MASEKYIYDSESSSPRLSTDALFERPSFATRKKRGWLKAAGQRRLLSLVFVLASGTVLVVLATLSVGSIRRDHSHGANLPHVDPPHTFKPNPTLEATVSLGLDDVEKRAKSSNAKVKPWHKKIWQTWIETSRIQPQPSPHTFSYLKFWQTWPPERKRRETWTRLNGDWRYELLLDAAADAIVEEEFRELVPEVWKLWTSFSMPVLKADLLRYLLLFRFGGIYADLDVECARSISSWLSLEQWQDSTVHTVVGTEVDFAEASVAQMKHWEWPRPFQFAQYAMATKPFAPSARNAIVYLVSRTYELAKLQGAADIKDISWSRYDVLRVTGPEVWTQAVVDSMMSPSQQDFNTTWREFANRKSPKINRGVAVLPIDAFGAGQRHSGSGSAYFNPDICLSHNSQGSWKLSAPNYGKGLFD